ncbi:MULTISPECIES: ATP-binding cassette domain-containing protein [Bacillus cereus group]|uniref:ATP-binding cassette domain-containing protein n=1 Tax=Bacillus cereus group TaxID=86661 RepID=UPI0024CB0083|nr:ATP-binding cassette domain-containing protein [Bacillus paranthracis]MED1681742.1 ATP-binding cassette domain-containing protein [Bacillus paranthracis]WAI26884.1 MAG: ATP-binding cassette domain-containing protein [Bacillus paranthracis]WAI30147.1 MAG: ATP-binding cassette domain-containing protein [Bacillus paranthracis]WAI36567.1 MAG: ATP-binding cassette domain-containing protein [Bacillus paranthracis]
MKYILETSKLVKIYESNTVVDSISLHIEKGKIYGLLGENGAGKTTTIRMIMGLLKPTSGDVYIFGNKLDINNRSFLGNIGAIIEYPGFYGNLSATDNLKISSNYMGVKDSKAIDRVLNIVNLQNVQHQKVKNFSLGMKQRLGIARSLLHNPDLLLLDEPTNGLDPAGIKEIRELLIELAKEHQKTILVSSHILGEVQQVADNIGIIHEGRLLEESSMNKLDDKFGKYIRIKVNNINKCIEILKENVKHLDYRFSNTDILINHFEGNTAELNKLLNFAGIDVYEIVTVKQTLEDYFMQITGGGGINRCNL